MGIAASVNAAVERAKQSTRDAAVLVGIVLVFVLTFLGPILRLLSLVQNIVQNVTMIAVIGLVAFKVLAPEKLNLFWAQVQAHDKYKSLIDLLSRTLGDITANAVNSLGTVSPETRSAIQTFDGYSFAVMGAKGQGKSKFLDFLHQNCRDGTPVTNSQPTADTDGSGVTKTVFKIPTHLKPFGSLLLDKILVNDWDVPGLFDNATWSNKLRTAQVLRQDMIDALKDKQDQTKWAFILVIKVSTRLDAHHNSEDVMKDFNDKMGLDLSAIYKATCIVLTGLDDLIWPGQDELYAGEKFDFSKPGQLQLATQSWLSTNKIPEQLLTLVNKCGKRALLWSNRPERVTGVKPEVLAQLQVEALVNMIVSNQHKQDYSKVVPKGCFPGSATVQLQDGSSKLISDLRIGDRIRTKHGHSTYYLTSHQDPAALTEMVSIVTESGHSVTATPDHYIPLHHGGNKPMGKVISGDLILVQNGDRVEVSAVKATSVSVEKGLYNPISLSGDMIVQGVVVSCWSEWFLEGFLSGAIIPSVYQAITFPIRLLYHVLPKSFVHFASAFEGDALSMDQQPCKITVTAIKSVFQELRSMSKACGLRSQSSDLHQSLKRVTL